MTRTPMRGINNLINSDKFDEAIVQIRKELKTYKKNDPDQHWLWACYSMCVYEKRQYRRANQYAKRAYSFAPDCCLTLWVSATALEMIGAVERDEAALELAEETYKLMLTKGFRFFCDGNDCNEGERWTKSVLNDCRYRLGTLYSLQGDYKRALRWMKLHLRMRKRGQHSVYSLKQAQKLMRVFDCAAKNLG